MKKEEIKSKIDELYSNIYSLKNELKDIELLELKSVNGRYYKRTEYDGIVIGKVVGLGEWYNGQLRCMELSTSINGLEFSFWYNDVSLSEIDDNWITKEEFNKCKKEILDDIDVSFR